MDDDHVEQTYGTKSRQKLLIENEGTNVGSEGGINKN